MRYTFAMNVKVIYEAIIKPSSPTPNHLCSLRVSLFDQVNTPVLFPLVFFYSRNHVTKISTREILSRLQGSLPSTLSVFYPLAGRVQDTNHISCNDEGVPYAEAEVNKPLNDVVHKAEVSQIDKLLPPYGQARYSSLLLAIQVNVFTCGGLAIGVKMNHAIADGFSYFMFVKTWASMANSYPRDTLLDRPYFDLWKLFPPSESPSQNIIDDNDVFTDSTNSDPIKVRQVTKWFMFREFKLDALRSKLFSYINKGCNTRLPSLGMVLSAFIWSRIMVVCHNSIKNDSSSEVYHAVNVRPRVSPPGEQSYYSGNMYVYAIVKLCMGINNDNISRCQANFMKQMEDSIAQILSNDEFEKDLSTMREYIERESKGEIVTYGFTDLRRLPVYEADFGWGKPVWVTTATVLLYKDYATLIPVSPLSKDIVAYINLTVEDMAKLECDEEFTAFCVQDSTSSKL